MSTSADKEDILSSRANSLAVVVVKVEAAAVDWIFSERTDARVTREFAGVVKVICADVDATDHPNHVKRKGLVWQEESKLHYLEVVADVGDDDEDVAVVAAAVCIGSDADGNASLHLEVFDETGYKD